MIGLDCNILIQLALADHPANVTTVAAIQRELGNGEKLVFSSLIVTEFLHVVTDPRRHRSTSSPIRVVSSHHYPWPRPLTG